MALRKGLVYTWATCIAGMVILRILYMTMTPVLGTVSNQVAGIWAQMGIPETNDFYSLYLVWEPILSQAWTYIIIGGFVGLLIYIGLAGADREPNEILMGA